MVLFFYFFTYLPQFSALISLSSDKNDVFVLYRVYGILVRESKRTTIWCYYNALPFALNDMVLQRRRLVCCSLNASDEKDKAPFGVLIHIGTTSIEKLLPKPIQLVDFDDPNFLQKHENTHFENTKKKLIRKNIEKPHYKNKKIVSLRLIRKKKLIASGFVSYLKFRIYCSKKPFKKQTLEKF